MNREFFVNLVFLILVNLLIKPFYIFGIDRTIQNTVANGDYGIYLALLNFTFLFQIINDFGIQQFNNRNISQYNQLAEKYFPNTLVLKSGLAVLYSVFVGLAAWAIGYLPEYRYVFGFFVINQILISLLFFLRSNIAGLGHYRTDSIVSILDRLILIIVCGVLLWANPWQQPFQIEWFVYAQTFSLSLTTLIAFGLVFRKLRYFKFEFNFPFLLLILKKSYPYALMIFLMTAYTRVDMIMIERLLPDGKFENDIYGAAYRLLDAANMIGFLFAGLLLPMFSKLLKDNRREIGSLVRFSLKLILGGAIPFVIATYFFQVEIMDLLYVRATEYWATILGYLIITFIAVCITYIYGSLLTANDNTRQMNIIFGLGFLFNVILNYFLIIEYKALGATIATVITQFAMAIAQVLMAQKALQLKTHYRLLGVLFLFVIFTIVSSFSIYHFSPLLWWINFLLLISLNLVLALVLRLIDVKYLYQLFVKY